MWQLKYNKTLVSYFLTGIRQLFHTKSHDYKSISREQFSTWHRELKSCKCGSAQSDGPREERDVGYIHIPRQIQNVCNKYIGL